MVCPACRNAGFRLSRFRSVDLLRLAVLQYPIRCLTCSHRMYGGVLLAIQLRNARRRKHHALANG